MSARVLGWLRPRRYGIYAGLVLWAALAAMSVAFARKHGLKPLEALVTWDEWAVALLLLPWFGSGLSGTFQMFVRNARRMQAMQAVAYGIRPEDAAKGFDLQDTGAAGSRRLTWVGLVSVAAWVVFALDVALRAGFGLGWQPFV